MCVQVNDQYPLQLTDTVKGQRTGHLLNRHNPKEVGNSSVNILESYEHRIDRISASLYSTLSHIFLGVELNVVPETKT